MHHLLGRLTLRGHNVLYVDPHERRSDSWHTLFPVASETGLREVDHRLFVYTVPQSPWPTVRQVWNEQRRPRLVSRMADKLGLSNPVLVTTQADSLAWIEILDPAAVVYHPAGGKNSLDMLPNSEPDDSVKTLAESADVVLTSSASEKAKMERLNAHVYRMVDGIDLDVFAASRIRQVPEHALLGRMGHPRVGFIGEIGEALSLSLVARMAERQPHWQIILTGTLDADVNVSVLREHGNIHLIGYQGAEEIPGIVKALDAAVLPYRRGASRRPGDLSPYAYLATGVPVVATLTEDTNAPGIAVARTADEFVDLTTGILNDDRPRSRLQGMRVASVNTWDNRADDFERYLREALIIGERKGRQRTTVLLRPVQMRRRPQRQVHDASSAPSWKLRVFFGTLFAVGWCYYGLRIALRILKRQRPIRVRKILVTRLSRLGDMVVFMPTLAALRRRYPHARIVLAIAGTPPVFELLKGQNIVDEVRELSFEKLPAKEKLIQGWRLFREGFDLVLTGSAYFIKQEAYFAGAPHRVGVYDGHPLQSFNNHLMPLETTDHESDNNVRLVEGMTGHGRFSNVPFLPVEPSVTESRERKESRLKSQRIIGIHPGAQRESRRWPAKNFATLSVCILNEYPDVTIMFTGVPNEQDLIEEIRLEIPARLRERISTAYQQKSITEFLGMLSTFDLFISNDTGVMHLARAKGCPLVALLGPENEYRWGPYRRGAGPVRALRYAVPCAPCVRKACEHQYCMRALSVKDAMNAVTELLEGNPDGGRTGWANGEVGTDPRIKRCSWRLLHDMGFTLPQVTFVLTGGEPQSGRPPTLSLQHAERLMAQIRGQTYPNSELLIYNPSLAVSEALGAEVRCIEPAFDDEAFWKRVLTATRGEFIAVMSPESVWHSRKIADDVAVLVRNPEVNVAASAPFMNTTTRYETDKMASWGDLVFRRTYLEGCVRTDPGRIAPDQAFWKHEPAYRAHQVLVD